MIAGVTALVLAKAPVPGQAKTRLAADLGDADQAAELAAAALLDTLAVCTEAFGAVTCRLALEGDLAHGAQAGQLRAAVAGWTVEPQHEGTLGERIARAHAGVPGPVLQLGMDTPQVTAELLAGIVGGLDGHDAVLAPARDGGWWALALRDGRAAAPLAGVPLSTPSAYDDTRSALLAAGLRVGAAPVLRDVDRLADARAVATDAPGTRFAAAFARIAPEATR